LPPGLAESEGRREGRAVVRFLAIVNVVNIVKEFDRIVNSPKRGQVVKNGSAGIATHPIGAALPPAGLRPNTDFRIFVEIEHRHGKT
jgi:hypothetical protein